MKYIVDYDIDDLGKDELRKKFLSCSITDKDKILNYMKSFQPILFTSAPVTDVFTNVEVKVADNGYTDNEYTWYESEIYYFEKYNLKLNDDFIEYVLNKTKPL